MILLLTIPHEQESRFDADRPCKKRNEVNMVHLGDITKIHGDKIEPVDCITFGSPCQDLSIAGRRAGLAGERSGLFMEAVRIIKEMRKATDGVYPTFAIWENVPGAFSSNNGKDFRAVLEELARVEQPGAVIPRPPRGGRWSKAGAIAGNGWSLAWRQLDSQYFGVAQRRKRIALILDLGGQRAGEILFERTSLSRYPDPRIPAWKEVAGLAANCPAGNDRVVGAGRCCKSDRDADCGRTETDRAGKSEAEERTSSGKCCEAAAYTLKIRSGCAGGGKGALVQTEKVGTLSTLQDQTLFQLITEPIFCISGNMVDRATKQNGIGVGENVSFTMDTVNRHAVAYGVQEENPVQPVVLESNQVHATASQTGICPTLSANMGLGSEYVPMVTDHPADKPVVFENHAQDARYKEAPTCSQTVVARWGTGGGNTPLVAVPGQVISYGIGNGQAHAYASKEKSGTLDTMHDAQAVAIEYSGCLNPWDTQARRVYGEDGTFPALPSRESAGGNQQAVLAGQRTRWIVRRLTPTECERLQGYPDGWTDIGEWVDSKGKKHKAADSPRYKALGNSIALPRYKDKPVSMWTLIPQKLLPPTRLVRYCCEILKENTGKKRFIATGVRWAESTKRKRRGIMEINHHDKEKRIILMGDNDEKRKLFETCNIKGKMTVNPVVDWSDNDVWDYIRSEHLPINPLYCEGWKRVGCIGCPMAGKGGRQREFMRWPAYEKMYITSFGRMLNARKAKGLPCDWQTGTDVFRWWMEDDNISGQLSMDDLLGEDE